MQSFGGVGSVVLGVLASCASSTPRGVVRLTPEVETSLKMVGAVELGPRIAGESNISPNQMARQQMVIQRGTAAKRTILKFCIDEQGKVFAVRTHESSGVLAYDAQLERAIMGWAFRPYFVDGQRTRVCSTTAVTYTYL